MRGFLKEPLLHFAVLGIGLFVLYRAISGGAGAAPNEIVVDAARVDVLATQFARTRQRVPTEQELQGQLSETERKLGELQASRNDKSSMLMNAEQQAEIQRFLDEQVRIRRELRAVRRNLDQDIDDLGTRLKIINTATVPLLLTVLALLVVFVKRRKKAAR